MNEELPTVSINSFETLSTVQGYHVYKSIWVPEIGETLLLTEREPANPKGKYAVCMNMKKNEWTVEHLAVGKTSNFAKKIFYFLRADEYSTGAAPLGGQNSRFTCFELLKCVGFQRLRPWTPAVCH